MLLTGFGAGPSQSVDAPEQTVEQQINFDIRAYLDWCYMEGIEEPTREELEAAMRGE